MTIFVLKKYEEKKVSSTDNIENKESSPPVGVERNNDIYIDGDKSIAEIIAKALYKEYAIDNVTVDEVSDNVEKAVKVITTEQINDIPVATLKRVKKGDVVYIQNKGFKTQQEDWFLMAMESMGVKTFFTPNSLVSYLNERNPV